MKTVTFKKWIITACISFIATIILLIISILAGGTSMLHSIGRMDSFMATNTMHNVSDMMNFDDNLNVSIDFEYTGGYGCDASVSINDQDFSVYNSECDDIDDDFQAFIDAEVNAVIPDEVITTKQQLDSTLDEIAEFISINKLSYDQTLVDAIIDTTVESIENKFDNTPLTKQMGDHSDFEDYFESKCINGDDLDDYITTYINANII